MYNDAFCIGHDGVFGTINGLRMGRVPGILVRSCCQWVSGYITDVLMQVDWTEINAGWGQTLLLLYTIARKLDYTFTQYELLGSERFSEDEQFFTAIALFPWDLFPASKKQQVTRLRTNCMVLEICTLVAFCITDGSTLQWSRSWTA